MIRTKGMVTTFISMLIFIGGSSSASELSVLSQNVWGLPGIVVKDKIPRLKQFCDLLKKRNAEGTAWDVVLIQEMWLLKDQRMIEKCGYRYSVREDRHALDSGLVTLSRYPVVDQFRIRYRVKTDVAFDAESLAHKGALFSLIMHPTQGLFWVVNTHLASTYKRHSNEGARLKQLTQLSEAMVQLDPRIPVILGGDFNTGPGVAFDEAWSTFPKLFPNFKELGYDPLICTSCANNPYSAKSPAGIIDHVFALGMAPLSGGLTLTETFTRPKHHHGKRKMHYSDHYAWEAFFNVEREAPSVLTSAEAL